MTLLGLPQLTKKACQGLLVLAASISWEPILSCRVIRRCSRSHRTYHAVEQRGGPRSGDLRRERGTRDEHQ